jgi:sec-independent protein translocase protein TatA
MIFGPPAEIFGVDGIIILVVVVLVLFGSTQIPKLARSLGSAQKEFKKGIEEGSADDPDAVKAVAVPPAAVAPPASVVPPAAVQPSPVVQTPPTVEVHVEGTPGHSS